MFTSLKVQPGTQLKKAVPGDGLNHARPLLDYCLKILFYARKFLLGFYFILKAFAERGTAAFTRPLFLPPVTGVIPGRLQITADKFFPAHGHDFRGEFIPVPVITQAAFGVVET
ncbi:hypothetical protein SAMN02745218_01801 [Desulfofundulus australicus DSM 11792]|uniref:Uncharacterized protein n=1 Tax=Desulfofundulus australicus DSM 11792 TaxID=1121425 RepID=A0A1M5A5K3_9FIRM|nr:hypothetical protein SAMN02745218_01801 [Desulfofundulus australicus DSM 11792]